MKRQIMGLTILFAVGLLPALGAQAQAQAESSSPSNAEVSSSPTTAPSSEQVGNFHGRRRMRKVLRRTFRKAKRACIAALPQSRRDAWLDMTLRQIKAYKKQQREALKPQIKALFQQIKEAQGLDAKKAIIKNPANCPVILVLKRHHHFRHGRPMGDASGEELQSQQNGALPLPTDSFLSVRASGPPGWWAACFFHLPQRLIFGSLSLVVHPINSKSGKPYRMDD